MPPYGSRRSPWHSGSVPSRHPVVKQEAVRSRTERVRSNKRPSEPIPGPDFLTVRACESVVLVREGGLEALARRHEGHLVGPLPPPSRRKPGMPASCGPACWLPDEDSNLHRPLVYRPSYLSHWGRPVRSPPRHPLIPRAATDSMRAADANAWSKGDSPDRTPGGVG